MGPMNLPTQLQPHVLIVCGEIIYVNIIITFDRNAQLSEGMDDAGSRGLRLRSPRMLTKL